MMVSCLMCGAGAVGGVMDGWHGCGPQAGLGGGAAGDMELIEYQFPLLVHRYGFTTDSGGAGAWRGGCGLTHEVEALDHRMTTVVWGEAVSEAEALRFLQSGATGVIRKTASLESLLQCLDAAARGETWVEPDVLNHRDLPPRLARTEDLDG